MSSRSFRVGRSATGLSLFATKLIERAAYIATCAAIFTPNALSNGHLEGVPISRESEWRALIRACRDLLRGAPTDPAGARLREGCTAFGVRRDSTDAELDAIKPFEGRN